jgi:CRISPR-associated protein Cas5d
LHSTPMNTIEFRVWGRYALFTDPLTRVGGERCSYHLPTYEALKGVAKSIYWKPTIIWIVDEVRVMKRIRTQTKGMKPINFGGGKSSHDLAIYTFLTGDKPAGSTSQAGVEYQVRAHFEWNEHQPALRQDQIAGKHYQIALRSLERGGRQDIFLGTRDCQGYVEPVEFGVSPGDYDRSGTIDFDLMLHSFDYPDETGVNKLGVNFWRPRMTDGVIRFPRPSDCPVKKEVREMSPKRFGIGNSMLPVEAEAARLGV